MRVHLSNDDAEMIAAALRRCDESDTLVALADRFTPPERLTAILMPEGAARDEGGQWTAEDNDGGAIYLHPEHGWLPRVDTGEPVGEVDLVPTCPRCGCQSISYEEGCSQYWPHDKAEDGVVWLDTIGWDGVGDSGDGDPGLFCDPYRGDGCAAPLDLPEGWEIEWT